MAFNERAQVGAAGVPPRQASGEAPGGMFLLFKTTLTEGLQIDGSLFFCVGYLLF